MTTYDVHAHAIVPGALAEMAASHPDHGPSLFEEQGITYMSYPGRARLGPLPRGIFDPETRLAEMDGQRVDVQLHVQRVDRRSQDVAQSDTRGRRRRTVAPPGSAVLDAMAMGLAVVGTRAGGIPEVVVHGETGLLVPPGEPRPLAHAIENARLYQAVQDANSRPSSG